MNHALTVTLNGQARAFDAPMTVASLLAAIGLDARKVAVERNEEIVPRSDYAAT
ncbi:MAG TPA: sulfur carrier protein ThiS, partial [Acetobacteraceae bacterium]